jgi:hypothetical protein
MRTQGNNISGADSARSPLDHHAVSAVSELLMSGIWLEHRVRRFPKLLSALSAWPLRTSRSRLDAAKYHGHDRLNETIVQGEMSL